MPLSSSSCSLITTEAAVFGHLIPDLDLEKNTSATTDFRQFNPVHELVSDDVAKSPYIPDARSN